MCLYPAANKQEAENILTLEKEIESLESELWQLEEIINRFEGQIRLQLHQQIGRLRELNVLYKAHKAAKKAKRLEQKKRGKNYKEPAGLINTSFTTAGPVLDQHDQLKLKQLYKEAIVLVHPDKFMQADASMLERATQVTVALNVLYKSGKLAELYEFHEHIISGNAITYHKLVPAGKPSGIADPAAMLAHLKKRKSNVSSQLSKYKKSHIYNVLQTYKDPCSFIEELRLQFKERIRLMEKRTRKL